jgi:hypothetical protein
LRYVLYSFSCSIAMPNARTSLWNDLPLDEAIGNATHVMIRCSPATCSKPCNRAVIWLASDLQAKLPNCRTIGEMREKLYCRKCKRRGWVTIEAARR